MLQQFNNTPKKARNSLKHFTLLGITEAWRPENHSFKGYILGTPDFVEKIQAEFVNDKFDTEIARLSQSKKQLEVNKLFQYIDSLSNDRKMRKKMKAYALKKHTNILLKDIGTMLGGLSYPAISLMVKRFLDDTVNNKHLQKAKNQIDKFCKM